MPATDLNARESDKEFKPERSQARSRFTLDGDHHLENRLAAICTTVSGEVQRVVPMGRLEALLLGGGYGRGEGGVLQSPEGDRPYNDLEYYVFIRGNRFLNRRHFATSLHRLAHEMTNLAGVEVEFHIISSAQLRRSQPSMFFYDLVVGHQQLCGQESVLRGCDHHRNSTQLPITEATRLLMNRGTGLLLAKERLSSGILTAEDCDFTARNVAKAQLALGDAVLTVCGQYHWSCRERNRRLATLDHAVSHQSWFKLIVYHHNCGVAFKLHPHRSHASAGELREKHAHIADLMLQVWLWVEGQRLQRRFSSAREYATSTIDKCSETNPWRNRLLNAWIFGPGTLKSPSARRHPRERVLNGLAMLLWDREGSLQHLRGVLNAGPNPLLSGPRQLLDAYQRIWERVR